MPRKSTPPRKPRKVRFSITLDPDVAKAITSEAKQKRSTISAFINCLLAAWHRG